MSSVLFQLAKRFEEFHYLLEKEFESVVVQNSKTFFGPDTVYIDAKNKIGAQALGGSIPDGVLFDLSDIENPEFYLVEVELAKHDFFGHIFPQITKFFAFFRSAKSQNELVERLFTLINADPDLRKEFKKRLNEKELFKFLKDTAENSQNVLLVIDAEKEELPEIMEAYTDTWGKLVTVMILREYRNGRDCIYSIAPEFSAIQLDLEPEEKMSQQEKPKYSVEYHLDGVDDPVKKSYQEITAAMLMFKPDIAINPQKYYISLVSDRNFAFLKIRRKKLDIVIMLEESKVRAMLRHHDVKHLSEPVQTFYNGSCCQVRIENTEYLPEIIEVLKIAHNKGEQTLDQ